VVEVGALGILRVSELAGFVTLDLTTKTIAWRLWNTQSGGVG